MKNKKLLRATLTAILRFLVLIALPLMLVKYMVEYFSYLGVSISNYGFLLILAGVLYIVFKFLEEILENPKHKMVFALSALGSLLLWTYYILNRGYFSLHIERINLIINYQKVLLIFLVLLALRIPEVVMRYYLELQKYDQRKRGQSSAEESL